MRRKLERHHLLRIYFIFFIVILVSIVLTQLLIQSSIALQRQDGHVINVSGRQRMLSQKVAKLSLQILDQVETSSLDRSLQITLERILSEWKTDFDALKSRSPGHGLSGENSEEVMRRYHTITPHFLKIYAAGSQLIHTKDKGLIEQLVQTILANEAVFLKQMNAIVFQYATENAAKVNRLKKIEVGMGIFTFLTVVLEVLLIISPLFKELLKKNTLLHETNQNLAENNQKISEKNKEILKQKQQVIQQIHELAEAKQKAEQAAAAKANFLSNMSHEIRTPMNGVIGIVNILLEEEPTAEQKEHLITLKFSAETLLSIINDILDYSKIESGKLSISVTDFNLKSTIQNVFKSFYQQALNKVLQFKLNVDTEIPDSLKGDSIRIIQVLTNLLGNAIKFTPKGYVSIEAELVTKNKGYATIKIAVADSGVGIAKDKQSAIFEGFVQADSNTTRSYGGTGLGLAISKKLLELMGSKLTLQSELRKGSIFSFTLRLPIGDPIKNSNSHNKKSIRSYSFSNPWRILIVDDNILNIKVAQRYLDYWKLKYQTASNGQEAIEYLQREEYDLVLMDLQMPVMDGYTAVETIRSWEQSKFQVLPIVALSASAVAELRDKAINVGMNDFLLKPYKPEELFRTLERYLN